jgi:O-antigen/teichoic acid export membrane protein
MMDFNARTFSAHRTTQPAIRRVKLNSIWLLLARLMTQAQLILFTVLVARSLGVVGFGQYALVAALIVLGNIATTFGTDTLVVREVARYRTVRTPHSEDGLIASPMHSVDIIAGLADCRRNQCRALSRQSPEGPALSI